MDPLSITASIIAVIQLTGSVVSAIYNYRKDVKHAPKDATKIIEALIDLSQILEKLLRIIEKENSLQKTRLASLTSLIKPNGPLESCQKTLEELDAKLQPDNGWRAIRNSLIWPLKKEYVQKSLDEVAAAKATIVLALTVDQTSLALETRDSIEALVTSFETFRFDERRNAILSKLSPTDPTANHLQACRKHQKGTGNWFIKSEQYLRWVKNADSVLWVNGIPGCGKTVLCSTTIEDLRHKQQSFRPQIAVAYYYFNFQSNEEQQFVNLLRSITVQLSCQSPEVPDAVEHLRWESEPSSSNEYMMRVVEEVLVCFAEVYVVIDALDECEQREEVTSWIQELFESKNGRLHLLFSSRQDYYFHSSFTFPAKSVLFLNNHSFEMDIQLYVRDQLSTHPRMMKWPSALQTDIEQSLMANAGGLFRWVDCQLDILRKCLRVNDIKKVLDTPPKTLNETYDRILANIDEAYCEDAYKILQWLAFSGRLLRTNELNEVLAFDRSDPHHPIFDVQLRLPLLGDVLSLCSSLVTTSITADAGQDGSDIESLELRLAHNSVKDYLVSHYIRIGPSAKFSLEAKLTQSVMAQCCLTYLLQLPSPLDLATLKEFPLASYAAQFWPEHYRHGVSSNEDLQDKLALQLLNDESAYRNCRLLYKSDKLWQGRDIARDLELPALCFASLTGLSRMIVPLIAEGANPNESAASCRVGGALGAAAYNGDEHIVQVLLSAGANPDGAHPDEGHFGSPIAAAASQGHNAVIALLLQANANINSSGGDGQGPALYHAVASSRLETVKMLLDAGANADAFAGMSGVTFAVEIAARRADGEMLDLLFPRVYKSIAERVLRETAGKGYRQLFEHLLQMRTDIAMGLGYAARGGWSDIVQDLLSPNSEGPQRERSIAAAFDKAVQAASLDTIQILLENAAQGTFSSKEIDDGIFSLARRGHSLIVKYLLDRGANTKSQACQGALIQSAEKGYISTVQVLLSAGVSPDSHYQVDEGPPRKSCLRAAIIEGHVEIARLLLSFGADPNTQYSEESVLMTSIEQGFQEIFELLLEKGASTAVISPENARYDTLALPVHCAAAAGHSHILSRLLESGLEADSELISDGWTALFHAAKAGHGNILRLLIADYQADVNRRANKGTVAIHTAAYHNHSECVEVFLNANVDINIQDHAGRTSLHWASQEGSINAIRVLLEKGADVSVKDGKSMTAADVARAKIVELSKHGVLIPQQTPSREKNYEPILEMLVKQGNKQETMATQT